MILVSQGISSPCHAGGPPVEDGRYRIIGNAQVCHPLPEAAERDRLCVFLNARAVSPQFWFLASSPWNELLSTMGPKIVWEFVGEIHGRELTLMQAPKTHRRSPDDLVSVPRLMQRLD